MVVKECVLNEINKTGIMEEYQTESIRKFRQSSKLANKFT